MSTVSTLAYGTVSTPSPTFVNLGARLTPTVQKLYSLFIWNFDTSSVVAAPNIDISGNSSTAEFFFTVPPKSISISEPFTTTVIATQNGGKFIESHGSIFKNIKIQGTTGLRPNKQTTPQRKIPLLQTDSFEALTNLEEVFGDRNVPEGEATGFSDIHFLRNIFRLYSDQKATGSKIVMVWRNIKDDDYWICEPKDFSLSMNSRSPLTYEYVITLQGLTKFDASLATPISPDPLDLQRTKRQVFARYQEYNQNFLNSFLVISTAATRIRGAGYFGLTSLTDPLLSTIRGLTAISDSVGEFEPALNATLDELDAAVEDSFEALKDSLESTFTDDGTPVTSNDGSVGVLRRDPIMRTLRRLRVTIRRLRAERALRDSVANSERARRARSAQAYRFAGGGRTNPISGPRTAGSPAYIGNTASPTRIAESRVIRGEGIRDLCRRLLGDARRWKEIVLLNDLRPPYVEDAPSGPGILGPGDAVLYPTVDVTGTDASTIDSNNPSGSEREGTDDESIISQTYGRDIRVKSVEVGLGVTLTDLSVNQLGDIASVAGVENVKQAVGLKFATEVGTLPAHPYFGAKFAIGTKASVSSFNEFRVNTLATLLSDQRVQTVNNLKFLTVGDILAVSADLQLRSARDYTQVTFDLRAL
jgi:hypothetical protein